MKKSLTDDWLIIQSRLADLSGSEGIEKRRKTYAPYFLRFGKNIRIEENCRFYHPDRIMLDDDSHFNIGVIIYGSGGVQIGRHARIGPRCFIHSANHDVRGNRHRAFFENSFVYAQTVIGDNSLISANVSILSGAKVGSNSFVACGAVVTKNDWPDNCFLMGVPAVNRKLSSATNKSICLRDFTQDEQPSIAIIASNEYYSEAAKLLITSLGVPQVRVFSDCSLLPDSVHTLIAFGPPDWKPNNSNNRNLWYLYSPGVAVKANIDWNYYTLEKIKASLHVPKVLSFKRTVAINPSISKHDNALNAAAYYAHKRLVKSGNNFYEKESIAWLFFAWLAYRYNSDGSANIDTIVQLIKRHDFSLNFQKDKILHQIKSGDSSSLITIQKVVYRYFQKCLLKEGKYKLFCYSLLKNRSLFLQNKKFFLLYPELLICLIGLREYEIDKSTLLKLLKELIAKSKKTINLCYLGLISFIYDFHDLTETILNTLLSHDYFDECSACIQSSSKGKAFFYSPLLFAFLLCKKNEIKPGIDFDLSNFLPRYNVTFEWHFCSITNENHLNNCNDDFNLDVLDANSHVMIDGKHKGSLIDVTNQKISFSLLENWLTTLSLPKLSSAIEIESQNYEVYSHPFEFLWLSLFRFIQNSLNEPLIVLKPFPFGYIGALSLRYDVDRNTSSEQVNQVIAIQRNLLNAGCGSWYVIPGTPYGEKLFNLLPRFLQEVGTHALNTCHDSFNKGVTFHSGPNSEYWQGFETVVNLEKCEAIVYSEVLTIQIAFPRPLWINNTSEKAERRSRIWFTPLHFPLEGSTRDINLSYFDLLLRQFRQLIKFGGHVIIGSHPDLNQKILEDLILREELQDKQLWCAPIISVVERSKKILEYGNISIIVSPTNNEDFRISLISKYTLSDVRVQLFLPSKTQPDEICIQLNSCLPRVLDT